MKQLSWHKRFPESKGVYPTVTVEEMVEIDRLMPEVYGIALERMVEQAGRCLAEVASAMLMAQGGQRVVVLVGSGGNGAGGLVAARRLAGFGYRVEVHTTKNPASYTGLLGELLRIVENLGVPVSVFGDNDLHKTDLIIDAIIGYALKGAPRGKALEMINRANQNRAKILSLDTPSGLELNHGRPASPTIRADATLTLALPKPGLLIPENQKFVGRLLLADIGVPLQLLNSPPFNLKLSGTFKEGTLVFL